MTKLADKIVMRPLAALVPYASNSRTHTPAQIAKIARSIEAFGFTNPILLDGKNGMVAGHARLEAAKKLGLAEVPTIDLPWLSPEERQAYIIADNQLAIDAGWDAEMLRLELGDLKSLGFDLTLTGFGDIELGALLGDNTKGLTDPDDAPTAPEHPASAAGDLWLLGRHRLLCGDSTVATDVERVLGGVAPHLMVTDPPYGVDYDPDWRNHRVRADGTFSGVRAVGKVKNDERADWGDAWSLFPGHVAYVWHAGLHAAKVADSLETTGFVIRSQIIWEKQHFIIGRSDYQWQHEPCWYAVRKNAKGCWSGDRTQSTIWKIHAQIGWESARKDNQDKASGHSTQKPVECMRRPIENNSSPGQAVYDPFLGSGTTVIAAEQTGRSCIGLEISPAYCDVIVKRWSDFTGATATLDGDGRTFAEIAAERIPQAA